MPRLLHTYSGIAIVKSVDETPIGAFWHSKRYSIVTICFCSWFFLGNMCAVPNKF